MSDIDSWHQLCAYTLSLSDPSFIHQHIVDAFAAQNADERTKPIKLTFALIGLHLHFDRGFNGREVQRAHMHLARAKREWPKFPLPPSRGAITAADVMARPAGPERDAAIDDWARAVWDAFRSDAVTTTVIAALCEQLPRTRGR